MGTTRPVAHFFAKNQHFFTVIGILAIRIGGINMNRNMMKCVMYGEDAEIFIVGIILDLRLCLIGTPVLTSWSLSIGIVPQGGVRPRGDSLCISLIFCY